MLPEYVFLIQRDYGWPISYSSTDPEPLEDLQALVQDDLHETDTTGVWGTLDGHTIVTRYTPKPVGSLPEDHGKVGDGVPVAVAR
jgi:hypothetical protein